jgi:hypothetical protein
VQVLRERAHLAEVAAEEAEVDGGLEEVDAVLAGHRPDLLGIRLDEPEPESRIAGAEPVCELERLRGQPARVDAEHRDRGIDLVGHVDQDDAVDLERGRDGEPRREPVDRPLEERLGLLPLERNRELARFALVDQLIGAHFWSTSG